MSAILAIDGGGTRTRAGLYDEQGKLLAEAEGDATNLSMNSSQKVVQIITGLAKSLTAKNAKTISTVVAGISGAGRTGKAQEVASGLAKALGTTDVAVCSDAHMLSWANLDADHPILVIAGTGSVVITRRSDGSRVVTGGYGPVLGDEGGAYRLALEGIRWADEDEELKKRLVDASATGSLPNLFQWIVRVAPSEVATLAAEVTAAAEGGNRGAKTAVAVQARKLAELAWHGLERAGVKSNPLTMLVTGGLMESKLYREAFAHEAARTGKVKVDSPTLVGHRAALEIRRMPADAKFVGRPQKNMPQQSAGNGTEGVSEHGDLDANSTADISVTMSMAETMSLSQLVHQKNFIGSAIDAAAACLRAGGRIIYTGAGTSGRLGVLDASECPPTFGVAADRVIGLIAGGDKALRHSIEGAEDDAGAGGRDIDAITPKVGKNDIVIGITASGTTPYALGAIDRGKALGAKTALVCCNPAPLDRADIVIALDTGPEVLPGSTRLKAGTATKMVLNQISTGAMAKAGYVFEGRMVGVQPSNKKLRQRCIRIIAELTKEDAARAEQRLDETKGSIRLAVLMARKGFSLTEAQRRLDACRGVLRDALEMK